jgi:hypothetical protein
MPTEPELEITKWKFKYNARQAEHILLHHEFENYKKNQVYLPWLLALTFLLTTFYFYFYD